MKEFIVVTPSDTTEINEAWRNFVGSAGYMASNTIFSRLVVTETGGTGSYPDLAQNWESFDGARRWRFELNQHARWHDGVPLTAHDVAYTHSHAIEHGYHAASFLSGVKEINVIDDHMVEYVLEEPNAAFLVQQGNFVATHILPRHLFEGTDWATNPYSKAPVGSGPFRFVEHTPGDRIVLEAWEDYWGPRPGVDRIIIKIVPDRDECVRMIADGRAHYAPQDVLTMKRLPLTSSDGNTEIQRERGPGVAVLGFNYFRDRWQDKRLREAIARAVDRSTLEQFAEEGYSEPWSHFFPGSSYAVDRTISAASLDRKRVTELLDELGYLPDHNGVRLQLVGYFMETFDGHSGLAKMLVENLKEVGIEAVFRGLPSEEWTDIVSTQHDFDLLISGGNMVPDPEITASRFESGGARNGNGLANPRADDCYRRARAATTHEERIEAFRELQREWAEDVSWVPLFWYCLYLYRSTQFTGWADQLDFRIPYWHWGRVHAAS